ncbi:MAG: Flp pilus assembly complex ATPase component TadA, partial [Candidatus Omnitrophica bacterium]|nr:Flp pilus assembly complex ATPase component TadA [Candidatus Omnitrophota bacterium]
QVKPEIGLTFATGLRAFLRQDPDIIMVGEVRDLETAQICIRAALTGHLILSTLHTNDCVGSIPRLIDMGAEPYLVMASLNLLISQRLVRRLCQHCKEPYEPEKDILFKYGIHTELLYKAKGCDKCSFIGYKGRLAVFEFLAITENIRQMVLKSASASEIKQAAHKEGMVSLRDAGMKKVQEGLTTIEEVLQATIEEQ